jgi:hypothetical protein
MPEFPGRLRPPRIATSPATPALGEMYYDTALGQNRHWNGVLWATPVVPRWRKTVANKTVVNTITETDLLNGEITIDAGVMSTNRMVRLTAMGDLLNNSGGTVATPRLKLKLGTTVLVDTGALAAAWATSVGFFCWRVDAVVQGIGASTTDVWTDMSMDANMLVAASVSGFPTVGEGAVSTLLATNSWKAHIGNYNASMNTAVANALVLTVTLATANANENMRLMAACAEIV